MVTHSFQIHNSLTDEEVIPENARNVWLFSIQLISTPTYRCLMPWIQADLLVPLYALHMQLIPATK